MNINIFIICVDAENYTKEEFVEKLLTHPPHMSSAMTNNNINNNNSYMRESGLGREPLSSIGVSDSHYTTLSLYF